MKKFFILIAILAMVTISCKNEKKHLLPNKELATLFDKYFEERMQLIPMEATLNGDSLNNDKLYADFTDSYRAKLNEFFTRNLEAIRKINREDLLPEEKVSFDIFKYEMETTLEGLELGFFESSAAYPDHKYIPFHQFDGIPIKLGQFGTGDGSQPFKTVRNYDDWLKRTAAFPAWVDSAIVYFRKGISANIVLPETLVKKMIPQLDAMVVADPTASLFYGPVKKIPAHFSRHDNERITAGFVSTIRDQLVPAYKRLSDFLKTEYLPKARKTSGIGALPNGKSFYSFQVKYFTTTSKTPGEIYQTGLDEVKRIRHEMDSLKTVVGFKGDLIAFFAFLKNDKQFMPYKTPDNVLNAFRAIQAKIDPNLKIMFNRFPKSGFEIRQTEAYRAASASAEYYQGTPDGKRPGIFYIPILDATKFNTTSGMESLFLHEAIPGHHYQISLQQENEALPKFRRFAFYGAYIEGWALYCESLGKELGLYTDPYQYIGALGDEIHRAIRLVVDVGMHSKNMTREEAIQYMMANEQISEEGATAEIERYMAIPGQALSYKIGALKIRELRNKYMEMRDGAFNLASFHDEILEGGAMPLNILESKMDEWAERK